MGKAGKRSTAQAGDKRRAKARGGSSSSGPPAKTVPKAFRKIRWEPGQANLDWGGERCGPAATYLESFGASNWAYDPADGDEAWAMRVLGRTYDTCTMLGVLSSIKDKRKRLETVEAALSKLKPGGTAYITVKGIGTRGPRFYEKELAEAGYDARADGGGMITAKKKIKRKEANGHEKRKSNEGGSESRSKRRKGKSDGGKQNRPKGRG